MSSKMKNDLSKYSSAANTVTSSIRNVVFHVENGFVLKIVRVIALMIGLFSGWISLFSIQTTQTGITYAGVIERSLNTCKSSTLLTYSAYQAGHILANRNLLSSRSYIVKHN